MRYVIEITPDPTEDLEFLNKNPFLLVNDDTGYEVRSIDQVTEIVSDAIDAEQAMPDKRAPQWMYDQVQEYSAVAGYIQVAYPGVYQEAYEAVRRARVQEI